jgi:hypothetical protein
VHAALRLALQRGGSDGDNLALILVRVGWGEWLRRRVGQCRAILAGRRRSPIAAGSAGESQP